MRLMLNSLFLFLLPLCLHHPIDIWQKTLEEFLSILDVFVRVFDLVEELLSFLSHVVDVLFADTPKFITNIPLSYNISCGLVIIVFHKFVESISLVEPSNNRLHFNDYLE